MPRNYKSQSHFFLFQPLLERSFTADARVCSCGHIVALMSQSHVESRCYLTPLYHAALSECTFPLSGKTCSLYLADEHLVPQSC